MKVTMKAIKLTERKDSENYKIIRTNLKGAIPKEYIMAKHLEQLREELGDIVAEYDCTIDNGEMYHSVITYLITEQPS